MNQTVIRLGSREVIITEQDGRYWARLYVNHGETATLQSWKGKTFNGAIKWAHKILGVQQ